MVVVLVRGLLSVTAGGFGACGDNKLAVLLHSRHPLLPLHKSTLGEEMQWCLRACFSLWARLRAHTRRSRPHGRWRTPACIARCPPDRDIDPSPKSRAVACCPWRRSLPGLIKAQLGQLGCSPIGKKRLRNGGFSGVADPRYQAPKRSCPAVCAPARPASGPARKEA
jgi:hypothetical protein